MLTDVVPATANALRAIDYWPRTHSFSIGLPNAPDLKYARKVADFLNTAHHEYTYTFQEGLDAIPDVIWHLETYDVTTIRASTPMYLLSRRIKSMGVKMVLSGEGSDEVFGGTLTGRCLSKGQKPGVAWLAVRERTPGPRTAQPAIHMMNEYSHRPVPIYGSEDLYSASLIFLERSACGVASKRIVEAKYSLSSPSNLHRIPLLPLGA